MEEEKRFFERVKRDILYGHDIAPPSVDRDRCKGCGQCVRVCPAGVFEIGDRKAVVTSGERCFACGHCGAVCPEEAVAQNEAVTATTLMTGRTPAVTPDRLRQLIRERRSTRLFRDEPVSRQQLLRIVEAGRYSPTGSNRQDVRYIVLSDRDRVSELRSLVEGFLKRTFEAAQDEATVPVPGSKEDRSKADILRYYAYMCERTKGGKETNACITLPFGSAAIIAHAQSFDLSAPFSCAVALSNCSLMAHALGLGSCFLGFVQGAANADKKIKRWLGIPKENRSYGAMVVGHPGIEYRRLIERKMPEVTWR